MDSVLIRYHEIALKKGNRPYFIELLKRNLISSVKDLGIKEIRSLPARLLLTFKADYDTASFNRANQERIWRSKLFHGGKNAEGYRNSSRSNPRIA